MSVAHPTAAREPWILVCGGFHARGGMDRSNLALAERLLERGHSVYLIGHDFDERIAQKPGAHIVYVSRPAGSIVLGESRLASRALEIGRKVKSEYPNAIVVANGGNGIAADVNWVHYVHHASRFEDAGAPAVLRLKNRYAEWIFRRHERAAIRSAKLVITNSELTRGHVVELLGADPQRVTTVYLGANANWSPASHEQRSSARSWLGIPADKPVVVFVGALGHDQRKGFDTLWKAWLQLGRDSAWDAHLVVAGGGRQVEHWRAVATKADARVHVLGFTDRVRDVLAASDLLVSPVHYEPFGLNVTEAICCGVPAIVSAGAGVAELYPSDLGSWLLNNPRDHRELAGKMRKWRSDVEGTRLNFRAFGARLRERSWEMMADDFIALVRARLRAAGNTLVAAQ